MLNFLGILFCLHPTFGESPGRFYYFLECSTSWESVSASIRLLVSPLALLFNFYYVALLGNPFPPPSDFWWVSWALLLIFKLWSILGIRSCLHPTFGESSERFFIFQYAELLGNPCLPSCDFWWVSWALLLFFRMLNFLGIRFCLHPTFGEIYGRSSNS